MIYAARVSLARGLAYMKHEFYIFQNTQRRRKARTKSVEFAASAQKRTSFPRRNLHGAAHASPKKNTDKSRHKNWNAQHTNSREEVRLAAQTQRDIARMDAREEHR